MMVVIYVFAIIFTQLFRDTEEAEGCYENVLQSMNCLMLNVAACLGFGIFGRNTLSVWWNPRVRWLQKIWPPKRKTICFWGSPQKIASVFLSAFLLGGPLKPKWVCLKAGDRNLQFGSDRGTKTKGNTQHGGLWFCTAYILGVCFVLRFEGASF